ncbi:hypothetical protein CDO73_17085 [Saccharibacillus sp. O23]|uniref:ABC-2 transporter permease n=1 Tax=Saccharibacillus sp. O23 TaxID=2009338 RepID=UPI000B4E79CE|nr:ABC-2 transporter permease [Saccharibacillus sp. O23]OWR28923.1 hypothetical protein CDO73_17085 [Saccharibacillus sp. O23]
MHSVVYLVRKDILLVYRYILILFPFFAYMTFAQNASFLIYAMMPAMILFITSCTIDIQNGTQRFTASLPVSRRQFVLSKYASILPFTVIGLVFSVVFYLCAGLLGIEAGVFRAHDMLAVFGLNALVASIYLPVYYWLGPKGIQTVRIVFMILVIFVSTLIGSLVQNSLTMQRWIDDDIWRAAPTLLTAGLALTVLVIASAALSIKLYGRRDV